MSTAAIILLVIISILLGLIIGLLLHRSPINESTVDADQRRAQAYLKGVEYLLSNDHDSAIAVLTNLARSDTESIETYFALGSLFRQKGEYGRAIQIHQNLLARPILDTPSRHKALLALGYDYQRAGVIDKAIQSLQSLLDEAPDYIDALALLFDVYIENSDTENALKLAENMKKINQPLAPQKMAALYVQQARIYVEQQRFDKAKRSLKKAHDFDPASPEIPLTRADIHKLQEKPAKELEALLETLVLVPPMALEIYDRLKELSKLDLPVYERIVALADERDHDPFILMAKAYIELQKQLTKEAESSLRQAIEQEPRLTQARRLLGELLLSDKEDTERREVEEILSAHVDPLFHCSSCGSSVPTYSWKCPACSNVGSITSSLSGEN